MDNDPTQEWEQDKRHGKGTLWVREGKKLRKQYAGDWKGTGPRGCSGNTKSAKLLIVTLVHAVGCNYAS